MQSGELLMWWLRNQQELEQRELQRPILHAPMPMPVPPMDRLESDSEPDSGQTEPPRVIIIDL